MAQAVLRVEYGTDELRIDDDDERLLEVERLIARGMMLGALRASERLGELTRIRGPRAMCIAGWLLDHLGDAPRARRLYASAARRYPAHATVRYFHAHLVARERGPLEAYLSLRKHEPATATREEHAGLASIRARLLAALQDHSAADAELARCDPEALGAGRFAATRAALLEQRGEHERALAVLRDALAVEPTHRVLVQDAARLLEASNLREEALALLSRVEPLLEFPILAAHRASLERELCLYERELESLLRLQSLLVRGSDAKRCALAAQFANNAYLRGDFAAVARHAPATGSAHWQRLADTLLGRSSPAERRKLELPVLIQEQMGCAPSSLAIVSSYFGHPVDQVEVADQICYEGTASHSERGWVEARGWVSREFTVSFDSARSLIERGVPFLLVTVDIAAAHAQVVVGFDATRRTLLIRDPMTSRTVELDADELFEKHRAYGPRGHVLLPPERAGALEGLELPESELHDLAHALRVAIEAHEPERVAAALEALERRGKDHPLALWAIRSIRASEEDPYAVLQCSEALLERFPEDVNAELSALDCLATVGTDAEQRERLAARLAKPGAPWVFLERQARLLAQDAAAHRQALVLARRSHRQVPLRGRTIALLAEIERARGDRALARVLLRAAATLEPTDDDLAWAYFEEAFGSACADEAAVLLRERNERLGRRSGQPAIVLFRALEWLDRVDEAFAMLEEAMALRPTDGALLVFAAEAYARYRKADRARALLARAENRVSEAAFRQGLAALAEFEGKLHEALAHHQAVLAVQPLSLRSHAAAAALLFDLSGPMPAREHLGRACAAHPTHCGLRELYIGWLRGHDPAHVLPEIDALLARQPAHAWARRERALVLSELGEHAGAVGEAEEACRRAPSNPSSHAVSATVLLAAGMRERALAAARRAVELRSDGPAAVVSLLQLVSSHREQLDLLEWAEVELRRTSVTGAGLLEWHAYASGLVSDEVLLEKAEQLVAERPALWAGHHLVAVQQLRAGRAQQARELLERATVRFPFVPRLWVDLANACRALGDAEGELQAATRAVRASPSWTEGVLRLVEVNLARNDESEAARVLGRGLEYQPRAPELLRSLAELSFRAGHVERSLEQVRAAILASPEDAEGWAAYRKFASVRERDDEVIAFARALVAERPWNTAIQLRLAELLRQRSENVASLEVLEQALAKQPRSADALEIYALTLARIGRRDEALAACERPVDSYFSRGSLRARRACILWDFGEQDAACLEMRKVIAGHPDHVFAHQTLLEWETQRNQHEAAVRIARSLVKIAPLDARSFGFLGEAEQGAGDLQGASRAFAQAAELDPSYVFAAHSRIQIALELGQHEDAEAALTTQGPHLPAPIRDALEVVVASARRDLAQTRSAFARLARHDYVTPGVSMMAARAWRALSEETLVQAVRELLDDPRTNPELGSIWIWASNSAGRLPSAFALRGLARRHPEAAKLAVRAYFDALGERRAPLPNVLCAALLLRKITRTDDVSWGKVGYALTAIRCYVAAQLWLGDYARRSAAEAWMLFNYRLAALENHSPRRAARAAEHALTLPADDTLAAQLAFVAFARAAEGDIEGARALVSGRTLSVEGNDGWFLERAHQLIALADAEDRRARLGELRQELGGSVFSAVHPLSPGLRERWFARGVLRQSWSLHFFARRWMGWLILLVVVLRPHAGLGRLEIGRVTVAVTIVGIAYLVARLRQ